MDTTDVIKFNKQVSEQLLSLQEEIQSFTVNKLKEYCEESNIILRNNPDFEVHKTFKDLYSGKTFIENIDYIKSLINSEKIKNITKNIDFWTPDEVYEINNLLITVSYNNYVVKLKEPVFDFKNNKEIQSLINFFI